MALGKLSELQQRILVVLSHLRPSWTLTGGAALAGFHTKHRETRDLDLFFHHQQALGSLVSEATQALQAAGLAVAPVRTTAMFAQLDVRRDGESTVIDLVADPTPIAEPAQPVVIEGATILVETPHQLLVNKLCALLSRSEVRDLVDIQVLVDAGADLARALHDCPGQDAGFSPIAFAWGAQNLPLRRIAAAQGWPEAEIAALEQFRQVLVERVMAAARPDTPT
ncbi:MAG TPA: nucleotidyl transferase AbiEii/AbiGii toxin family protein [Kofleriaceae bacterium]|nr:nucleotidyl transferase AbiEii/AbiGii toxin family protein [Kofleriaceae bacterium]